MNAKQRREAVEGFRCPHCGKQGAGFYFQELTVTDWHFDVKRLRFKPGHIHSADEVLDGEVKFDGQYELLCQHCHGKVTETFDALSDKEFIDEITEKHLRTLAVAEELRAQTEIGLVQPGLRKKHRGLEEDSGT